MLRAVAREPNPRPAEVEPSAEPANEARSLRVGRADHGQRLAALVRRSFDGLAWNRARELCRRGKVRVNGAVETDGSRLLREGDAIEIAPRGRRLRTHGLEDAAVVYFDRHVAVVNKPAGLLSVPYEPGDKNTLADRLRFWLERKSGMPGAELGVVQRLDKDTSGLLVFARTLAAKRELQRQLRAHSIERRYLALVHGELRDAQRIESQLLADRGDGLRGSFGHFRRARGEAPAEARRALTHVRPLEALRGATLVECRLETGRQHQIRIHLSERGHPLIGERVYVRDYRGLRIDAERPMLHAAVLGFAHPAHGRAMRFEQAPPEDFTDALARLR